MPMKATLTHLAVLLFQPLVVLHAADMFIVEDGKRAGRNRHFRDSHADATGRRA